jgi:hypothetical protein
VTSAEGSSPISAATAAKHLLRRRRPREQGRHPPQHCLLGDDPLAQPDSRQDLHAEAAAPPPRQTPPVTRVLPTRRLIKNRPGRHLPPRPTSSVRRRSANTDDVLADLGYDAGAIREPPSLGRGEDGARQHLTPSYPRLAHTHGIARRRCSSGWRTSAPPGGRPASGAQPRPPPHPATATSPASAQTASHTASSASRPTCSSRASTSSPRSPLIATDATIVTTPKRPGHRAGADDATSPLPQELKLNSSAQCEDWGRTGTSCFMMTQSTFGH